MLVKLWWIEQASDGEEIILVLSPRYGCVVVETLVLRRDFLAPTTPSLLKLWWPRSDFQIWVFGCHNRLALATNLWDLLQQRWWRPTTVAALGWRDVELLQPMWIFHPPLATFTSGSAVTMHHRKSILERFLCCNCFSFSLIFFWYMAPFYLILFGYEYMFVFLNKKKKGNNFRLWLCVIVNN